MDKWKFLSSLLSDSCFLQDENYVSINFWQLHVPKSLLGRVLGWLAVHCPADTLYFLSLDDVTPGHSSPFCVFPEGCLSEGE